MNKGIINYKNGAIEAIEFLNVFSDGVVKFVSNSGGRYMFIPNLNGGTFVKEGFSVEVIRSIVSDTSETKIGYVKRPALNVVTNIHSISYPSDTEFEYTISGFSGKVTVPGGASKEEIKRAVDLDIYRQLQKIPVDQVEFKPISLTQHSV